MWRARSPDRRLARDRPVCASTVHATDRGPTESARPAVTRPSTRAIRRTSTSPKAQEEPPSLPPRRRGRPPGRRSSLDRRCPRGYATRGMVLYPAMDEARALVSTRVRRRVAVFAACAFAAVLEVYLVGVCPYWRTGAHGRHEIQLTEFGDGAAIARAFTAVAHGLRAVHVTVQARQAARLELHW